MEGAAIFHLTQGSQAGKESTDAYIYPLSLLLALLLLWASIYSVGRGVGSLGPSDCLLKMPRLTIRNPTVTPSVPDHFHNETCRFPLSAPPPGLCWMKPRVWRRINGEPGLPSCQGR